jgi:hypothetical protein
MKIAILGFVKYGQVQFLKKISSGIILFIVTKRKLFSMVLSSG